MTRAKQHPRAMSPVGVASLLPERARLQRRLETNVIDHFVRAGYQEVIPPLVEYLDVIAPVLGGGLVERAYTFADRATGRLMILRPDVTPQIARMVAQLLAEQREPLRFCYRATVFRHEEAHAGREREIVQIGVELIGPSDAASDAEIIVLALSALEQLGIGGVRVALGHPGVFEGLLEGIDAPDSVVRDLRDALARRDRTELTAVAGRALPAKRARLMESLIDCIGLADVLTEAGRRLKEAGQGKTTEALHRLGEIYRRIDKAGYGSAVLIDLGEVRGLDYYTGMVFELFVQGIGYEIGGGGRYDQLIGRFGVDRPSTGFAFSATPLLQLLARRDEDAPAGNSAAEKEGRHGR
jgi:ATP phosphoribosyltransferase regulatory subunit